MEVMAMLGVRVPEFYMCVKDTGTKYQLWISDFNIDGTFTRVHPFIISHTKTMTRTREDGKEEVFSACIKHDDTRYLLYFCFGSVGLCCLCRLLYYS